MYSRPDLHMHSVYSDGSDTPLQVLQKARENRLDIFSLTDHDSFGGCKEIREALRPGDPAFVNGIEFSCKDDLGKYHILGYRFQEEGSSVERAAIMTHAERIEKAIRRFAYIEEKTGVPFTEEEKSRILAENNPGRPHFARLMLEKKLAPDFESAFQLVSGLGGNSFYLTPQEAIRYILESGGIPVLAHGLLGEGSQRLDWREMEDRILRLKKDGLQGMECYYPTFSDEEENRLLYLAGLYDLAVTAGSDYHGAGRSPLGSTNDPQPEVMERFYRML